MGILFAAPGRPLVALAVFAFCLTAGARAQDAPAPSQQQPGTPSGQKAEAKGGRGGAANTPDPAEQHRLPPDSTTKHTLAVAGRTLAFTASAGSIRQFNDK